MQHYMYPDFGGLSEFGGSIYLLAIRKNIIYKLMWWLYKVRYDTVYFNDVIGYSFSDVTSGAFPSLKASIVLVS
jgi:hypothetical protein